MKKVILGFVLIGLVVLLGCASAPPIVDTNQPGFHPLDQNGRFGPWDGNVRDGNFRGPRDGNFRGRPPSMGGGLNNTPWPTVGEIATMSPVTSAELATHNTQEDCWVSYQRIVFDLTAWLPKHPGSAQAIAPYCGTSQEFEQAFSDQHAQMQVGRLLAEGIQKGKLEE